jgi:hypothetical protein
MGTALGEPSIPLPATDATTVCVCSTWSLIVSVDCAVVFGTRMTVFFTVSLIFAEVVEGELFADLESPCIAVKLCKLDMATKSTVWLDILLLM